MKEKNSISRRHLVKHSALALLGVSLPGVAGAKSRLAVTSKITDPTPTHDRYPAIRLEIASEVVGVAHFNLEKLKQLVDPRPELAKATWDGGFGDWESAIAAASHVGRKDIVDYLVGKGAVPTLFTYAMLGEYDTVKAMITAYPGIQKNFGPHGITLLQHAKTGLQADGVDKTKAQRTIDYLESLGDADGKKYSDMTEVEQEKYLGDYKYGTGEDDGFTIKLNMKKLLTLGRLGKSGGVLLRTSENEFIYKNAPSVRLKFMTQNNQVISLVLTEPGLTLTATKI